MRPLAVLVLLLALALAACGDDDEAVQTSATRAAASPTASQSPTPSPLEPTATPTADVTLPAGPIPFSAPKLVFKRGQGEPYVNEELWLANIDGSDPVQLTPSGIRSGFAGVTSNLKSGRSLSYYFTEDEGSMHTVWALDFHTGQRTNITRFDAWGPGFGAAAVNPAGTHLAYADKDGLWLLDLGSGATRLLLEGGDRDECGTVGAGIAACKAYGAPVWSPGGSLLGVRVSYWEGGEHFIVDPFAGRPVAVHAGEFGGGHWSPDGTRFCTWGRYAAPSAVYIATSPDWAITRHFQEFEEANSTGTVTDCGWMDNSRLIVTTSGTEQSGSTFAWLLDAATGARFRIAEFPGEQTFSRAIAAIPGDSAAVATMAIKSSTPTLSYVRPVILSADGSVQPVLEPGDWVVAVIAP